MKLEEKYLILKWEDISNTLRRDQRIALSDIITSISVYRALKNKDPDPQFLCIRDTWPEYKPTLKLLSERVDNEDLIHS